MTEKELTNFVNECFDKVDKHDEGELGYDKRIEVTQLLQSKLNLTGNAFNIQANLMKDGDTDGNMLISRQELLNWTLEKRREAVYGKSTSAGVAVASDPNETEEQLI